MLKDISSHIHTIYNKVKLPESLVKLMPTNEPKVSGYLPPAVYNIPPLVYAKLMAFKVERGLESVEMAVSVILEEYFAFTQTPIPSGADATTSRLETLEQKCSSLTETVAELQMAISTIQASSSQSKSDHLSSDNSLLVLPNRQNKGVAAELINSPAAEQGESIELSAVNHSQMTESESQQLSMNETPGKRQAENTLPEQHAEALELTGAYALFSEAPNIEPGEAPNIEPGGEETFSTPMRQADLAKRLGVATSSVSRMQSKQNFPEWSKHRDPEGIAWVKSADTKLFYPQSHKQV
jgi:hypothetical protein